MSKFKVGDAVIGICGNKALIYNVGEEFVSYITCPKGVKITVSSDTLAIWQEPKELADEITEALNWNGVLNNQKTAEIFRNLYNLFKQAKIERRSDDS